MGAQFVLFAAIMLALLSSHGAASNSDIGKASYLGAAACAGCHSKETAQWKSSHHYQAMQPATATSVLGDFDDVTVQFHNVESRLFKEGDRYYVETAGVDGVRSRFAISYTFGFEPLQQYLIELDNGHLQALNLAWDNRPAAGGGQRWFHLRADDAITPQDPFYWTRHFQNWNSRCAECHSTNVARNYSPADHSYNTTFSEVNVACEACHGPASEHVSLAGRGALTDKNTGFARRTPTPMTWQFVDGEPIAEGVGQPSDHEINTCGACHSLRTHYDQGRPQTADYHAANAIQLINEPQYFANGEIQEEVFVLGSFLQSKMHAAGVTCSNCHEPHSGKLLVPGNGLCAQCHQPAVFDRPSHFGEAASTACVDCHMPARTYMGVDDRRDHSFVVPGRTRPTLGDKALPPIWQASLLAELAAQPSPESARILQPYLTTENPLVRRGAVMGTANMPPDIRWQLLQPVIGDDNLPVRMATARVMADFVSQLPEALGDRIKPLFTEYRSVLAQTPDTLSTQLALADVEMGAGNAPAAEAALRAALRIEPNYLPAILNMGDYLRAVAREDEAAEYFRRGVEIAPMSAAANHALGLHLIRRKQYEQSLSSLRIATELDDAVPNFAYVYAVALESQGQLPAAIDTLKAASERWPDDYNLLITLVRYLEKSGARAGIAPYVRALSEVAPTSPEVQQLMQQYGGGPRRPSP